MQLFVLFTFILSVMLLQGCSHSPEIQSRCPDLAELKQSAAQGDIHSQVMLGEMYSFALCVPQDSVESRKWFSQAAPNGGPLPKFALANMYHHGAGGVKDDNKAIEWYEKTGQQGLSDGYAALAHMYGSGDGVEKNPVQAKKYADLAASTNDSVMTYFAGQMHETGEGAIFSQKLAKRWYRASCMKGFSPGCKKYYQLNKQNPDS